VYFTQDKLFCSHHCATLSHGQIIVPKEISPCTLKAIEELVNKQTARVTFITSFMRLLITFYLTFIDLPEGQIESSRADIEIHILQIVFGPKHFCRWLSWYLFQLMENQSIKQSHLLLQKLRKSPLAEGIDLNMLQSAIKKANKLTDPLPPLTPQEEEFFTHPSKPPRIDKEAIGEYLEVLSQSKIPSIGTLLTEIRRISQLLPLAPDLALCFPMRILRVMNEWLLFNFGPSDPDFYINVFRLVAGQLPDSKLLISLFILNHFTKNINNNNILQLLINSITIDLI